MKVIKFCILVIIVFCGLVVSYLTLLYIHPYSRPTDFSSSYPLAAKKHFSIKEPVKESIRPLLKQRFYYLGYGKQMTAYESEDHTVVIKFFNHRRFVRRQWFKKWSTLKRMLSMKWVSSCYFKKKQRLQRLAKTQLLAFQDLPDESGILYVHVNDATKIDDTIIIYDDKGIKHRIKLDKTPFVLQKKASLALDNLASAYASKDRYLFLNLVASLADLFMQRVAKGYTDRIQTLHNNYGFAGGKAIQLDVGRLAQIQENESSCAELMRVFHQLEHSVQEFFPDTYPSVHQMLEEKLATFVPLNK